MPAVLAQTLRGAGERAPGEADLARRGPLQAQQAPTSEQVHAAERTRLGFGELRRGATSDPGQPNSSNSDEAKVGTFTLPPLYTGAAPTPAAWQARRAELARLVEDNWVGRIPNVVSQFRVVWRKEAVPSRRGTGSKYLIDPSRDRPA